MDSTRRTDDVDRQGFDENRNYLGELVGKVVPQWLARRAVTIAVSTERRVYDRGETVPFTVTIENRLPVSVSIPTPQPRLWGWAVDGVLEATDEAVYTSDASGQLALESREVRRIEQTWSGRIERTGSGPDGRSEWVLPEPGTHELSVFIATKEPRATDSIELELR